MKKLTILLIVMTFALKACGQTDQTFTKPVYFNAGFYLGGTLYNSIPSGGSNDWNILINKPTFYPVDLAPLDLRYKSITYVPDYSEIKNKPAQMDLNTAIPTLSYLALPQKTTTEISALVIPSGTIAMVWDKTIGALKIWNGTIWKIYISNQ
jgi:hypothetical protein